jgi:outer membrane protein OmpA-like peptidoglycan-associated protein
LRIAEQARREEQRRNRRELLGAGLVGLGVGAIISGVLDGEVVADQGDRIVVRQRDGSFFLRKDENELLRRNGTRVRTEQLRGGRSLTTARRPNGVEVVTLRNQYGDILHRIKRYPNGDEVVLIDNRNAVSRDVVNYERTLPPVRLGIPLSEYIVDAGRADRDTLEDALTAHPVEEVEREYSLREIRENNRLREKVRRVDLDAITFQTGSARVTMSQVDNLDSVGSVLSALVKNNPGEVFLVEGYTDAVGGEVSNLVLSDRRAEAIAKILVEIYDVPPENLITQGYGERYLKVPTLGPSQANRRVTVRRITPLLTANR